MNEDEYKLHIEDLHTLEELKFDICEKCKDELVKLLEAKEER